MTGTDDGAEPTAPRPPRSRLRRRLVPAIGLAVLVAGVAVQLERLAPVGRSKAARLATAFLAEADPTFRPAGYRPEVIRRDPGEPDRDCWEVRFLDRGSGRPYKGFFVFVYRVDGLCVLSHSPRYGPQGEWLLSTGRRE